MPSRTYLTLSWRPEPVEGRMLKGARSILQAQGEASVFRISDGTSSLSVASQHAGGADLTTIAYDTWLSGTLQ